MAKGKYPNSGTLGKNKRKTAENHPEYSGQAEIDGVAYWISAWLKEGQDGKFFSLSFKKKDQQQGGNSSSGRQEQSRNASRESEYDDDGVPF